MQSLEILVKVNVYDTSLASRRQRGCGSKFPNPALLPKAPSIDPSIHPFDDGRWPRLRSRQSTPPAAGRASPKSNRCCGSKSKTVLESQRQQRRLTDVINSQRVVDWKMRAGRPNRRSTVGRPRRPFAHSLTPTTTATTTTQAI